jgi:alpha-galactosidase
MNLHAAILALATSLVASPSTTVDPETVHAPCIVMGEALRKQNRDIVNSLCQYGWMDVQKWGKSVGGNLWRTTDDIGDSWGTISRNGFALTDFAKNAGPGGWNDPDMLVVGQLGPGWGAAFARATCAH